MHHNHAVDAILVIAHGTHEPLGNEESQAVAAQLAVLSDLPVHVGFLDHAVPLVPDALAALYASGARRAAVLPLILSSAGHVKKDIPRLIADAHRRFPDLSLDAAPHLAGHEKILEILLDRLRGSLAERSSISQDQTVLLLVGRGSSDPDAAVEIQKIAAAVSLRSGIQRVEIAFMGVSQPLVADALEAMLHARPRRILILPYLLFYGKLIERLEMQVDRIQRQHPEIDFCQAARLGPDPRIADVLLSRFQFLYTHRETMNRVLDRIDSILQEDPRVLDRNGRRTTWAADQAERRTAWIEHLCPTASWELRIAARGQHIRRWSVPRDTYPLDRTGYLRWREDLKKMHAETVSGIMTAEGCSAESIARVTALILKKNIKGDPETQALEDSLCLVFLETEFATLRAATPVAKMPAIIRKTWAKMSEEGHAEALKLPFSDDDRAAIAAALAS